MNRYERHLRANPPKRNPMQPPPGDWMFAEQVQPGFVFKLKNYPHETWECVRRGPHKDHKGDVAWVTSKDRPPCPNTDDGLYTLQRGDKVISA